MAGQTAPLGGRHECDGEGKGLPPNQYSREEVIRNGSEEEGSEEEGHEEEGCEEEVTQVVWTWHVHRGLVGAARRPIPNC
jgi:hypothetical protein